MVAGSYLMVMVDKTQQLLIAVMVTVDKAELAVAASSKLHTSNGKKWQIIHPTKKLLTIGSLMEVFHHRRFNLDLFLTGV